MSTITAKDLTKDFPRSPFAQLEGFAWLPRVIDKMRALQAGKIGEYTPFPCGGDKRFVDTLGLDADAFKAVVFSGKTDEEIASWVKANATAGYEERLKEYAQGMTQGYPAGSEYQGYLDGAKAELKAARPEVDLSNVKNFGELICVEEGHTIPSH